MIRKQKELWEEVLKYSKGTDSERQVYHRLEMLENKEQEMRKIFSTAEKEIEMELKTKQQAIDIAQEFYEKSRRVGNNED